ncbi:hypothetical protein F2P56_024673, partial [Juglans regia]
MQAYYIGLSSANDLNWHPDTGVTHHLTSDLSNLNVTVEAYTGLDTIRVGNGTGLNITHLGTSKLSTPTLSFLLHNVLHVPQITKNLIYVQKFTAATNTFFEFHPSYFFV